MAACTLIGRNTAQMFTLRPVQLRSLLQGLQYLETEIVFACTPLPVAYGLVGEKLSDAIGELFLNAADILKTNPDFSPKKAWDIAYKQKSHKLYLRPQDEAIVNAFLTGLGQSHRDEQLKQLRLVQELLRGELEKSIDESKKFARMYNTLGISVGLVLVILLF